MPLILEGIRLSLVINVGTATIGSTVAAKGLGEVIIAGLLSNNTAFILQGGLVTGLMAILLYDAMAMLERRILRTVSGLSGARLPSLQCEASRTGQHEFDYNQTSKMNSDAGEPQLTASDDRLGSPQGGDAAEHAPRWRCRRCCWSLVAYGGWLAITCSYGRWPLWIVAPIGARAADAAQLPAA